MASEFNKLFDDWSKTYDDTVAGTDPEYRAVFAHYEDILQSVADRADGLILEFGVGTGNLTERILSQGKELIGYEPSVEMRKIAKQKLPGLHLFEGDFLEFPIPDRAPDTVVSTYAFHHLTDEDKKTAITRFHELLSPRGKIIFADTVFANQEAKEKMIRDSLDKNYGRLAQDLQTEYYTTIPVLTEIFGEVGFESAFIRKNDFVWLIEAVKKG
ncbi:class I SAM-dependent DNA methyltransferase [Bhargavaea ginsengi]|uniref:class I SAM-dependent DNA methyltransferase n=1 Tax=Bhargavaea ginsengi TaxID=426757 RepID=UPI00203AA85A|nr:class I SAM-dependent methyltransferase [Bhargavaea ginsengi]MCM3087010.1 class I SAM-dependent methyltransferase [Bhargavaea ginsengi]